MHQKHSQSTGWKIVFQMYIRVKTFLYYISQSSPNCRFIKERDTSFSKEVFIVPILLQTDDRKHRFECPQHTVNLAYGFLLGDYVVE